MTGSVCRASFSWCMRSSAFMPEGLTARRSKRAHDRRNASSCARLGAKVVRAQGAGAQAFSTRSKNVSNASIGMPIG